MGSTPTTNSYYYFDNQEQIGTFRASLETLRISNDVIDAFIGLFTSTGPNGQPAALESDVIGWVKTIESDGNESNDDILGWWDNAEGAPVSGSWSVSQMTIAGV